MDDQLREDRRRAKIVIKELREHQQEVEEQMDEAVDCRSDVLTQHFKKAEANMGKSKTVDQALLDAQIGYRLGQCAKRQAAQLQTGLQTYDVKTYTDHLVHFMRQSNGLGENDPDEVPDTLLSINFISLGVSVSHCQKAIPGIDFMHGNAPVENVIPVAERKKAKRIKKGKITVKPSELRSDEVEQTETDRQVAEMRKELERRTQCNYWMFVIDPSSFSRSIENIFHSSFLIKDRLAALDLKLDPPMIKYMDSRDRRQGDGEGDGGSAMDRQSQFIMGFDRNIWQEKISEHDIRKCILPRKLRGDPDMDTEMRRPDEIPHEQEMADF